MSEKHSPHQGHRQRMRERFFATSPSGFADHELLEMLLYYTNPRRDTNEIAHSLIEAFGSIEGVLDADRDRLLAVWGMGEQSALLFSLFGELSRRYLTEKMTDDTRGRQMLDTPERLARFLAPRFVGATKEIALALLLDNSMYPIDCFPVGEGTVSGVALSTRAIAERAYTKHAAAVVLAHNHPGGVAVPSSEDIHATGRIREALDLLGIPLIEHFVFSDRAFAPILQKITPIESEAAAASSIFDTIKTNFNKPSKEDSQ